MVWIVIALCVVLFFGFPLLTLCIIKKSRASDQETTKPDAYSELKASLLFLQMAFPVILFLLGALGYGSYELILKNVTASVQAKFDTLAVKQQIVAWTREIEEFRLKAESDANLIASITTMADDSLNRVVDKSFLKLLPKGTIIPFKGKQSDIDLELWAICDGTRGTPDMRNRFILGGTFSKLGTRGGTSTHSHSASTTPLGKVDKRNKLDYPHFDGSGKKYDVERHDHSFKGITSPVAVSRSDHLPPYYQLVFLMKIR